VLSVFSVVIKSPEVFACASEIACVYHRPPPDHAADSARVWGGRAAGAGRLAIVHAGVRRDVCGVCRDRAVLRLPAAAGAVPATALPGGEVYAPEPPSARTPAASSA